MTQQLQVSILAAPLAAIDPRALSQAWYSALALQKRANGAPAGTHGATSVELHAQQARPQATACRGTLETPLSHAYVREPGARNLKVYGQALQSRSQAMLAERIERVFEKRSSRAARATFSLGRGAARVHVILQTKGSNVTLLALCRPELRVAVAHALSAARAGLASRGIGVEVRALGKSACS